MFKFKCFLWFLVIFVVSEISGIYVQNELKNITKRHQKLSPAEWTEPYEDGLWSTLLEEYTLKQSSLLQRGREGRIIQTVSPPQLHPQQQPLYHKYIPTSEVYINKRIGDEAIELEPNLRRPPDGKVVGVQKPSMLRQGFVNSPREVSETDLYLLGAIEKLVYRVDYLEKRLKRTEQLVYYLMAGNNHNKPVDPCPTNFTKVGDTCYHFGIDVKSDWKTASTTCRAVGAHLAEFDKIAKFQNVVAHVLNTAAHRGHDFWLGGLNPGLLWIWAGSARPVNPNANVTSLSSEKTDTTNKVPAKVLNQGSQGSKNGTSSTVEFPEIKGDGRCLRLSYNPSLFNYGYTGHDCSSKHNFICELPEKALENEITRIAKKLNFE